MFFFIFSTFVGDENFPQVRYKGKVVMHEEIIWGELLWGVGEEGRAVKEERNGKIAHGV